MANPNKVADVKKTKLVEAIAAKLGVRVRAVWGWHSRGCPLATAEAVSKWRADNVSTAKRRTKKPARPIDPREATGPTLLPVGAVAVQQPTELPGRELLERQKLVEDVRSRRLRNDKIEDLLTDRAAREQAEQERFLRLKGRLEAIPDEIEMMIPPEIRPDLKREIADAIHNMLKEIASWMP